MINKKAYYFLYFKKFTEKLLMGILLLTSLHLVGQGSENIIKRSNQYVFEGNNVVEESFIDAEKKYRSALSENPTNAKGSYNLGRAYYNVELYDEALARLIESTKNGTKLEKHHAFHNIGNILMINKDCKKAVEAFKNALRNNPSDDETRYNLALAQECAEEEGGGDDKNDEKEQDKKEDKENEDKKDSDNEQDKDQKNKEEEEEKKDSDGGKDQEQDDGSPKDDKGKQEDRKNRPQEGKLSPQQVKNLLEAMNNEENKVQEKINASKSKGVKVKTDKDW